MIEKGKDILRIVKGAGINLSGALFGNGLRFLYIFFLAKVLTQAEVGTFSLGITILKLLVVVSVAGLDTGVLRFMALYKGVDKIGHMEGTLSASLWISFSLSTFVGVAVYGLSGIISRDILGKPELTNVLKIFSMVIPFFACCNIFLAVTQSFKRMEYKVYSRDLAENIVKFVLTALFFWAGWRLVGAVVANALAIAFSSVLAFVFMRKVFRGNGEERKKVYSTRHLLNFSLPNALSEIAMRLIMWTDILMLGYFMESKDLGTYYVAAGIVFLGLLLSESFAVVFNPTVADLHNKNLYGEMQQLLKTVSKWIFTTSLPFYLGMILFAHPLLRLYGEAYVGGAGTLVVLSIAYILHSLTGLTGYTLLMTGKSWLNMVNNILICIMNIALNYVLIPRHGILGAAIATGLSVAAVNFLRAAQVLIIYKMHPYKMSFFKPVLAGGVACLVTVFRGEVTGSVGWHFDLILGVPIFLGSYALVLWGLGIDQEEKFILEEVRKRLGG